MSYWRGQTIALENDDVTCITEHALNAAYVHRHQVIAFERFRAGKRIRWKIFL